MDQQAPKREQPRAKDACQRTLVTAERPVSSNARLLPALWRGLAHVRLAWGQIRRRPLRSFLILQGLIWGTALALFGPGSIAGSRQNAFQNYQSYQLDRILVTPDVAAARVKLFGPEDLAAIRKALSPGHLRAVSGLVVARGKLLEASGAGSKLELLGVGPELEQARDFHPALGRYINQQDLREKRPVCVLEPRLARDIFASKNPLGQHLSLTLTGGHRLDLAVVGVMEERRQERLQMDALGMSTIKSREAAELIRRASGVMQFPGSWERDDRALHLPASLLPGRGRGMSWVYVRIRRFKELEACADTLAKVLTARGRQAQLLYDASLPYLVGDQLKIYLSLNRAISITCLVMGLVAICNLLLVGVLSRQREIGIRRVEGATRGDILFQFLAESATLGLLGALLGIPASYLLARIWLSMELSQFASYALDPGQVLRTLLLVVGVALAAGLVPAWRAARLDPVMSLNSE